MERSFCRKCDLCRSLAETTRADSAINVEWVCARNREEQASPKWTLIRKVRGHDPVRTCPQPAARWVSLSLGQLVPQRNGIAGRRPCDLVGHLGLYYSPGKGIRLYLGDVHGGRRGGTRRHGMPPRFLLRGYL